MFNHGVCRHQRLLNVCQSVAGLLFDCILNLVRRQNQPVHDIFKGAVNSFLAPLVVQEMMYLLLRMLERSHDDFLGLVSHRNGLARWVV